LSLDQHTSANQLATIAERSNRLQRKIAAWRDIQVLYMPEAAIELAKLERAQVDGISGLRVQAIPLKTLLVPLPRLHLRFPRSIQWYRSLSRQDT